MTDKNKIETKIVTPEIAKDWLEKYSYEHQRNINKNHVTFLAEEMEKGDFSNIQPIQFSIYGNGNGTFKESIIDGQHRLNAIVKSNISQEMIIVTTYAKDEKEVAKRYSCLDQNKIRKWGDTFVALDEGEINLKRGDINAVKAAFGLIYRGFMSDGIRESNVLMYEKTKEWEPYAKDYFNLSIYVPTEIKRILKRKHMVALGISTLRFAKNIPNGKTAQDFWYQVALDDGLRFDDPRKKLRELLIQSQVLSSNRRGRNVTAEQCFVYAVSAWNSYVQDKNITRLVLPKNKQNILYTPFDYSKTIAEYRKSFEYSNWGDEWV